MEHWGFPDLRGPEPEELSAIDQALSAFRLLWEDTVEEASRPSGPNTARASEAFTRRGDPADAGALDYLQYELTGYGPWTAREAALICGEIVRDATGFRWIVDDRDGQWFLTSGDIGGAVWPYGRLRELNLSGLGGGERCPARPGIHTLFVQQAAFDALADVPVDNLPKVRRLLDGSALGFDYLRWTDERVRQARGAEPPPRAGRGVRS